MVGPRSGGGSGFIGQGGVGAAIGGVRWFGPTGRDQSHVPQGEPTFRRGGGHQGRGKNVGVPGAGVGGPRLEERGARWVWRSRCLLGTSSQREQAIGALDALIQVLGLRLVLRLGARGGVITSETSLSSSHHAHSC